MAYFFHSVNTFPFHFLLVFRVLVNDVHLNGVRERRSILLNDERNDRPSQKWTNDWTPFKKFDERSVERPFTCSFNFTFGRVRKWYISWSVSLSSQCWVLPRYLCYRNFLSSNESPVLPKTLKLECIIERQVLKWTAFTNGVHFCWTMNGTAYFFRIERINERRSTFERWTWTRTWTGKIGERPILWIYVNTELKNHPKSTFLPKIQNVRKFKSFLWLSFYSCLGRTLP